MNVPDNASESKTVPLIPTGNRVKLPQALSYPLGAKAISEALEAAPQTGSLRVKCEDRMEHCKG
ncbi:MAG TPA: hypothetical protein VHW09_03095 [Bryobacteraceae bacterium]|jgi:hypothetical protein|nr:hypothetical protein [Bryobacteraceae bacterium]